MPCCAVYGRHPCVGAWTAPVHGRDACTAVMLCVSGPQMAPTAARSATAAAAAPPPHCSSAA
eukprot:365091-Chlamydomonas_euryale.AAC.6